MLNRFVVAALAAFMVSITASPITAQFRPEMTNWQATNGPFGGLVKSLAANSTTLFAGTSNGGVFRSIDGGRSWQASNTGLTTFDARVILATDRFLYLVSDQSVIWRSADNGSSWQRASSFFAPASDRTETTVRSLFVSGGLLYAGTQSGVYRSADDGTTWIDINGSGNTNLPFMAREVTSIGANGFDIFVGSGAGVHRASFLNAGVTWSAATSGLGAQPVDALLITGVAMFVATPTGIFRSENNGSSWQRMNTITARRLVAQGRSIFAGSGNTVFRSDDNGFSWTPVFTATGFTNIFSLVAAGGNVLTGTTSGIFRSADNGQTWQENNMGINGLRINALNVLTTVVPSIERTRRNTLLAGTDNGIFRSINNGADWTSANQGLTNQFVACLTTFTTPSGQVTLAGTTGGGVFRSTDGGITWTPSNRAASVQGGNSLEGRLINRVERIMGRFVFACASVGLFRSNDDGLSWSFVGIPDMNVRGITEVAGILFAGVFEGGVYMSRDTGRTWTLSNTGLTSRTIRTITRCRTRLYVGTERAGVFQSLDTGATWTAINNGLMTLNVNTIFGDCPTLYAGTDGGGIFAFDSATATWTPRTMNIADNNVLSMAMTFDRDTVPQLPALFAGTAGRGVFITPLLTRVVSIGNVWENLPAQAYPNPVSDHVTLEATVRANATVTVRVLNVLGTTLLATSERATSTLFRTTLDCSQFASGVYVLEVSDGKGRFVQQIIKR